MEALTKAVNDLRAEGERLQEELAAEREDRRRAIRRTVAAVAVTGLLVAMAFAAGLLTALDRIDTRVDANSRQIARTQYDQCQIRNTGTRRQNALLQSAIAAEKRKPKPDRKRIADLTNFLGATPDCGPAPK